MTIKAYIVANKRQEREVLEKLEQEELVWFTGVKPTKKMPSSSSFVEFPYVLFDANDSVAYGKMSELEDEEIVFDGRKEEKMSEKYVVSQEFMNELGEWRDDNRSKLVPILCIRGNNLNNIPDTVSNWWIHNTLSNLESNNRLIAIIRWVNGEDVFEIEKPKKWVVRSKEPQGSVDGEPLYIWFVDELTLETETEATMPPYIRRFNTKEEAQSWANAHQEVVEVEE